MVLAQYYNFVRFGHEGYRYIMETMQANARALAERIAGDGVLRADRRRATEQLPLVAFQLTGERDYDEFDVASQLAAERGWMVPAYTLPPNAEHVDDHARAGQAHARPHARDARWPTTSPRRARRSTGRAACTRSTASARRPAWGTDAADHRSV